MATEQDQKTKEKLFGLTPDDNARVDYLIQYAYKSRHIAKPSLQDFMQFAIQCAASVIKQDWDERKRPPHHRRSIV